MCSYITENFKASISFKVIGCACYYTLITYYRSQSVDYIKSLYPQYLVEPINVYKELVKFFMKHKTIYKIDYHHYVEYYKLSQHEVEESEINTFKSLSSLKQ